VTSSVSPEVFNLFLKAVEGQEIKISNDNITGLSLLCDEFGFTALASQLLAFRAQNAIDETVSAEIICRLGDLEERLSYQERAFSSLQNAVSRLSAQIATELPPLVTLSASTRADITALSQSVDAIRREKMPFRSSLDSVRKAVGALPIDRIETNVSELGNEVHSVRRIAEELQDEVCHIRNFIQELPIVQMEGSIQQFGADLSTLQSIVRRFPIQRLEWQVSRLQEKVESISSPGRRPPSSGRRPPEDTIQFFARLPDFRLCTLAATLSDPITYIKELVFEKEGIPMDAQKVIWRGRMLNDAETMGDCSVRSGTIIDIRITPTVLREDE
jgi:hypothetical protein